MQKNRTFSLLFAKMKRNHFEMEKYSSLPQKMEGETIDCNNET